MTLNRREFLATAGSAALSAPLASCLAGGDPRERPNILWITCEDISPNLGCYGDTYAVTPHLDRLATESIRYDNAFAPIGVCAPSRSCIITGMYPPSIGTQHMRCQGTLPPEVKCFTEYLRAAGYYCSNNVKTDYNFKHPPGAWDECSARAHWRKRKPGQPFFSVFNFTQSHESQIRLPEKEYVKRTADFTPAERHDPAKAPIPPYHPDVPEVRKDWARYYDMITVVDKEAGALLDELAKDGLADDTIVMFYSDHGAGMPRGKRWLYDSSLRVPLLIRFPKKLGHLAPGKPGSRTDRLVSFVDFAPTALSLAEVKVPPHMQGKPFLGQQTAPPREVIHGFRDRMDERYDMIRCVSDKRYKYIRNFMPHLPWFGHQYLEYLYQMPTMRVWQRLSDEGKLTGPQAIFMARSKPVEELYDTHADPWELRNLTGDPQVRPVLERMRTELKTWMANIGDLSLLPEADLRERFGGKPQYSEVRRDPGLYPMARIEHAAALAGKRDPADLDKLTALLTDDDAAVRYRAATGLLALSDKAARAVDALTSAAKDTSVSVRLTAAEALCGLGRETIGLPILAEGLSSANEWGRLHAANALDRLDERARPVLTQMIRAHKDQNQYVIRVIDHALSELSH